MNVDFSQRLVGLTGTQYANTDRSMMTMGSAVVEVLLNMRSQQQPYVEIEKQVDLAEEIHKSLREDEGVIDMKMKAVADLQTWIEGSALIHELKVIVVRMLENASKKEEERNKPNNKPTKKPRRIRGLSPDEADTESEEPVSTKTK